jgi:hypothetical protein
MADIDDNTGSERARGEAKELSLAGRNNCIGAIAVSKS